MHFLSKYYKIDIVINFPIVSNFSTEHSIQTGTTYVRSLDPIYFVTYYMIGVDRIECCVRSYRQVPYQQNIFINKFCLRLPPS